MDPKESRRLGSSVSNIQTALPSNALLNFQQKPSLTPQIASKCSFSTVKSRNYATGDMFAASSSPIATTRIHSWHYAPRPPRGKYALYEICITHNSGQIQHRNTGPVGPRARYFNAFGGGCALLSHVGFGVLSNFYEIWFRSGVLMYNKWQ